MSGYFYIGYGQCGIDSGIWAVMSFARIEAEMPSGIAKAIGVTTLDGDRFYAFMTGTDGNLWVNYWSG